VDGKPIATSEEFAAEVAAHKPGDRITVAYTGQSGQRTTTIAIAENPNLETVTFEDAGKTPSAEQLAFRNKWLASKAK
jgi:PDZ domain-containing secreted protein